MLKREIDLHNTDFKTSLRIMMAESKINSFADIARNLDIKETTFRSSITNDSIKLVTFLKIAESLGYTLVVKPKDN